MYGKYIVIGIVENLYRIIDKTGEDYLYSMDFFERDSEEKNIKKYSNGKMENKHNRK